jgi:hypothetical protein
LATQLKQIPIPQAIGVSSETWQGTPAVAAIPATAFIMGIGPQATIRRLWAGASAASPSLST